MTTTPLGDTITLTPTPGHSPCHCCVNIVSRGQKAVVTGDMMHHAIQCRELDWSPGVDWDPKQAAGVAQDLPVRGRGYRHLAVAESISPTRPSVWSRRTGERFNYRFKRD